ncbi:hypothetical protein [Pedobacter sp.]
MKKHYLALFLVVLTVTAFGQSNFYRLSVGAGAGGTYTFTDVQKGQFSYAFAANLDYHITPFITAGIELQKGTLKGADGDNGHKKAFVNSYLAYNANFKFRAGQVTDFYYSNFLNYTKGFYLGTGIGMVNNDNTSDKTIRVQPGTGFVFDGEPKATSIAIPLNVGIDFYFPDGWGDIRYILNVNYQTNITLGDELDSYNAKPPFQNTGNDFYNFLSVGFKYTFGPKGLTGKSIR